MRRVCVLLIIIFFIAGVLNGNSNIQFGSQEGEQTGSLHEEVEQNNSSEIIEVSETETQKIKAFFEKHSSPLADYAGIFCFAGSKYNIRPELLVAISGIESSFGKRFPVQTHNPFGIYSRSGGLMHFDSLNSAIIYLAKMLSENKVYSQWQSNKTNLRILAQIYCPPNWQKWEEVVKGYMEEIDAKRSL